MSLQPPTNPGPTWTPGSVIGGTRYEVKRLLGSGGMGTVYEVQHLDEGTRYALKVLSSRVAEQPDLVERVLLEAHALQSLRGAPYVVEVVASGRLNDAHRRPYLVMELLRGATLRALLGRGRLPVADALSYVHQLLWGLAGVHGAGVVHRDVKPDNVFVQSNGECKLLDFGVIKVLYDIGLSPSQFSTGPYSFVGTPMYMAPEAASGQPVDTRADIFAVGLILYECLTGSRPLAQLTDNEYLHHVANQGIPSLDAVGATDVPIELRRIVRRATIFDADHRYQTAQEFAVKLNHAAETLGIRLREAPPLSHASSAAPALRPLAATLSASAPPARVSFASPEQAPLSTLPMSRTRRRPSLLTLASSGHDEAGKQSAERRGAPRFNGMAPSTSVSTHHAGPSSSFSSLARSVLPRLEDAIARLAGMLTPVRQAREAAARTSAAAPQAERQAHDLGPCTPANVARRHARLGERISRCAALEDVSPASDPGEREPSGFRRSRTKPNARRKSRPQGGVRERQRRSARSVRVHAHRGPFAGRLAVDQEGRASEKPRRRRERPRDEAR
jgi:eukaryotic-like serine/threonine-protein kinase